jgi:hypothetical protein
MAEFNVVIEGLDLDDAAMEDINNDIQRVVLNRLAGIDITKPKRAVIGWRPRPDWYGLIAYILDRRQVEKIEAIQEINARFER